MLELGQGGRRSVVQAEHGGGVLEVQAVGQAVVGLQQRIFSRYRQHAEDAATVVVEQDHHQGAAPLAEQGQAVEIVQGAEIAEQQCGRLVAGQGETEGSGDQAVDAGGAAVGHQPAGALAGFAEHVHQPGRHAVADEQLALDELGQPVADPELGEAIAGAANVTADALLALRQPVPGQMAMVHRMGRGEGAGRAHQAATQPVVRIQPGRLRVHQPVILPGVLLDELAEPLGDEAGTELQQHLGPGQLGHEAAVLQGEIHVDEVAAVEADLALQVRQQRPAEALGQLGHPLRLGRILNAARDYDAAFALQGDPVGLAGAVLLALLPGAPGLP